MRAKQYFAEDTDRSRTMGVLLHGDGSFAGQGVVYETLDMSHLPDYTTGGTVRWEGGGWRRGGVRGGRASSEVGPLAAPLAAADPRVNPGPHPGPHPGPFP